MDSVFVLAPPAQLEPTTPCINTTCTASRANLSCGAKVPHFASETDKVCRQTAFGDFPSLDKVIGAGIARESKKKTEAIASVFFLGS